MGVCGEGVRYTVDDAPPEKKLVALIWYRRLVPHINFQTILLPVLSNIYVRITLLAFAWSTILLLITSLCQVTICCQELMGSLNTYILLDVFAK